MTLAVGLVAGLAWLGERAARELVSNDRYRVPVSEIECDSPPGSDRSTFLTEVRYLADLPATVSSIDPELPAKLSAGFAKHPWVASVTAVEVSPEGKIRVRLAFRAPHLAVEIRGEPHPRVVDRTGVLLPESTSTTGLPILSSLPPPTTPAGVVWPSPDIKRALELLEIYSARELHRLGNGWRLRLADGRSLTLDH